MPDLCQILDRAITEMLQWLEATITSEGPYRHIKGEQASSEFLPLTVPYFVSMLTFHLDIWELLLFSKKFIFFRNLVLISKV